MSVDPSPVAPPGAAETNPHPQPSQPPNPPPYAPPAAAEANPQTKPAQPADVIYSTKTVDFFERRTPIIYQGASGPCPLFAICNHFLLKGAITLDGLGTVSQEKMLSIVSKCLHDVDMNQFQELDESTAANLKQKVIDLVPDLPGGIDMNMHLTSVDGFEFTTQRALFYLLGIPIYHGFLVDPQDVEAAAAVGSKTYDDLVTGVGLFENARASRNTLGDPVGDELKRAILLSLSGDGEVTADISRAESSSTNLTIQSEGETVIVQRSDGEILKDFYEAHLSQLTMHGIHTLHNHVKEDELCVLFYNNHFNTLYKHQGSLYILANYEMMINEIDLVWKRFDQVDGDAVYITSKFTLWERLEPVMNIDSLAYANQTSGGIPSTAVTYAKMSDTLNEQSHGSKLLNASKVNAFILKKEWEALDDYLVKFVARVLKKTQDEVVMLHPGLFFIPRMERLLDMLTNRKFEEASSFFKSSIELLQGCQGTSVALDLIHNIEELNAGVEKKSWPVKRDSAHEIGTSITDYMHVCFPSAILRDDGASEGLWQFAMRLPKPEKQGQDKGKLYYPFRCFLCGWVTKGKHSLSHLRKHLIHQSKDIKMCYKVTEDVLARLMAMDEANVPAFEFLKDKFSKVRKPNLVSWADPTVSVKRPRDNTSGSLDTLPAQLKHPRLKLFEQSPTTFKSSEEAERAACSLSSQPKQSTFPAVDILPGQLKHPHLKLSEQSPSTTFKSSEEAERAACSLSLSQQKHSTFPAATVPDKVTEPTGPVWVLVCKLNEETDAINSRINPSIIPSLDDILSVREIYLAFQEEVLLLRQYARTHDQRSDSEELSELVRSVLFGAKAFVRSLTADVVPVKEDRLFFITSVSKVMEMLMEI